MPYNEVFGMDGVVRPAYKALRRRAKRDPLAPPVSAVERLRESPLDDDTRTLPVPLALEEAEYRTIQAGVAQRALALQALFHDIVTSGGRSLAAHSGITLRLLEEILEAHGTGLDALRRLWESHDSAEIRFVYAPDLARRPDGRWTVLEDNVGCVGGTADSFFVANAYAQAVGLPPPEPAMADLIRAVSRLRDECAPALSGNPVVAIFGCEPGSRDPLSPRLLENARRALLLEHLGVHIVDGDELERLLSRHEPAPAAVVNFEAAGTVLRAATWARRHVPLLNAPGTEVLGNKALLPFVDELIQRLFGEQPLLATPPTRVLRGGELPAPGRDWVVKSAAGAGGSEVYVLSSLTPEGLYAVAQRMRALGPSGAVAQQWVEPSTLTAPSGWDAYRIELRPLAYVLGWEDVFVGDQPLGKAVSSFDRRRLNNISLGACYLPVRVEATAATPLGGEVAVALPSRSRNVSR